MLLKIIYNFLAVPLIYIAVSFAGFFNSRIRKTVNARSGIIEDLTKNRLKINPYRTTVLFHCSSMGEYRQILPVAEALESDPERQYNLILSLYSPSAYENIDRSDSLFCIVTYSPLDFYFVTRKFINIINPDIVLISKHDVWPNFLWELKRRDVPVYLVNALFADDTKMDIWYIRFFYKAVFSALTGILTVNETHRQRFLKIYPYADRIEVTGDTRFDTVYTEALTDIKLEKMETILTRKNVFVAGSTWPVGERYLLSAWEKIIKKHPEAFLVMVPHEVNADHIYKLESMCQERKFRTVVYTEISEKDDLSEYDVLIVDIIGILSKIYRYGSIAYVGGGFSRYGIHSVLEPAAYGLPVTFGPNLDKSPEAKEMNRLNCGIIFNNAYDLFNTVDTLWSDDKLYEKVSEISSDFIVSNSGASKRIQQKIQQVTSVQKFDKNISLTEEEFEKLINDGK